ncbi:MAG: NTPase [Thermoprotei archaeon]|nr:MAG: NTPase [Thermoprotei archaeon]
MRSGTPRGGAPKILVTGRPGIGKTTVVRRVAELCSRAGLKAGGMVTYEVREGGRRVGFKILDLMTGEEGVLAWVGLPGRLRVGRYTVSLEGLEGVGVRAIRRALEGADVVIIDEIGPMELYSEEFKRAVEDALASDKPVVATIHVRADRYPFCRRVKSTPGVKVYTVTLSNRNALPRVIFSELSSLLRG